MIRNFSPSIRGALYPRTLASLLFTLLCAPAQASDREHTNLLPRISIRTDGQGFVAGTNAAYVPVGVNFYLPGTGWAPQVWKEFDPEATRRAFARMRELQFNCVRVFLTFGSFYTEPGRLNPDGLAKLDQFIDLAEEAGIYVHPTGPDHWEGLPEWAQGDRIAADRVLEALESFWTLLATRYRGRTAIFAYDLLNEPEVGWDSPALRSKWSKWVERNYSNLGAAGAAWGMPMNDSTLPPLPPRENAPGSRLLLDYQRFREEIATEWTRRQAAAIKTADPRALVTVGLIQWSVPALLAAPWHYSGFRPAQQAEHLDFLEVHFYPLDHGAYQYAGEESEARNLAYLECVVREVARPGKPVVIGEFGWYGGGRPGFDGGKHPHATEAEQARWGRRLIETTKGLACGWLNWGFYDHPESTDVSQLTGLLRVDGTTKAWGREFSQLSQQLSSASVSRREVGPRPELNWDALITSAAEGNEFRDRYYRAYLTELQQNQ